MPKYKPGKRRGIQFQGKFKKSYRGAASAASRGALVRAARFGAPIAGPRMEKKYIDTVNATYACTTGGSVTYISGVGTGDDANSRDGRQISICSIQVRGMVYPEDDTTVPCLVKILVILDKTPSGVLPALTDILAVGSSESFMNLNYRDRFVTLASWTGVMAKVNTTATQAIAGSPTAAVVDIYKYCKIGSTYQGTTGAIASAATNAIYLVTVGNVAAGAAATLSATCRVRFYDN